MSYKIEINNKWEDIKISPEDLVVISLGGKDSRKQILGKNAYKSVLKFCRIYCVKFEINKQKLDKTYSIDFKIPSMRIHLFCIESSYTKAKRTLAYKLHREYCRKIKLFINGS